MHKDQAEAIIGLTRYVVASLKKAGHLKGYDFDDDDLISVGHLAGVQAFKRYDETKGKLSTWLVPRIRGAVLDYINKEATHGMGGKHTRVCVVSLDEGQSGTDIEAIVSETVESDGASLVDAITYGDSIFAAIPAQYMEPEAQATRDDLERLLNDMAKPGRRTPEREEKAMCFNLLVSHFGLFGFEPQSLLALEQSTGVKVTTNYARLRRCLKIIKSAF